MNKTSNDINGITHTFGFLKPKMRKTSRLTNSGQAYPYRSASISFEKCTNACEAVREIEGTRFLVQSVPTIPVPDCTSRNCKCSYVRHKDRRGLSEDRRALYSLNTDLYTIGGGRELRMQRGRRIGDKSIFAASDAEFASVAE